MINLLVEGRADMLSAHLKRFRVPKLRALLLERDPLRVRVSDGHGHVPLWDQGPRDWCTDADTLSMVTPVCNNLSSTSDPGVLGLLPASM